MFVCVKQRKSESVCVDWVVTWKLVFSSDAPASTSSRHTACCFSEAALCNAVSPLHTKHKDSVKSQQQGPKIENDNTGRTSLCPTDPEAPLSLKREETEAALAIKITPAKTQNRILRSLIVLLSPNIPLIVRDLSRTLPTSHQKTWACRCQGAKKKKESPQRAANIGVFAFKY